MKLSMKKVSFLDRFGEEKPKNGAFAAIPRIFSLLSSCPAAFFQRSGAGAPSEETKDGTG